MKDQVGRRPKFAKNFRRPAFACHHGGKIYSLLVDLSDVGF
jgi:hypothetical protein